MAVPEKVWKMFLDDLTTEENIAIEAFRKAMGVLEKEHEKAIDILKKMDEKAKAMEAKAVVERTKIQARTRKEETEARAAIVRKVVLRMVKANDQ